MVLFGIFASPKVRFNIEDGNYSASHNLRRKPIVGNEVEEEWERVLKQAVTYNPVYEP